MKRNQLFMIVVLAGMFAWNMSEACDDKKVSSCQTRYWSEVSRARNQSDHIRTKALPDTKTRLQQTEVEKVRLAGELSAVGSSLTLLQARHSSLVSDTDRALKIISFTKDAVTKSQAFFSEYHLAQERILNTFSDFLGRQEARLDLLLVMLARERLAAKNRIDRSRIDYEIERIKDLKTFGESFESFDDARRAVINAINSGSAPMGSGTALETQALIGMVHDFSKTGRTETMELTNGIYNVELQLKMLIASQNQQSALIARQMRELVEKQKITAEALASSEKLLDSLYKGINSLHESLIHNQNLFFVSHVRWHCCDNEPFCDKLDDYGAYERIATPDNEERCTK